MRRIFTFAVMTLIALFIGKNTSVYASDAHDITDFLGYYYLDVDDSVFEEYDFANPEVMELYFDETGNLVEDNHTWFRSNRSVSNAGQASEASSENTVYGDAGPDALSLDAKIEYIRDWYYDTQNSLGSLSVLDRGNGQTAYYDGEDCVRVTLQPGSLDPNLYPRMAVSIASDILTRTVYPGISRSRPSCPISGRRPLLCAARGRSFESLFPLFYPIRNSIFFETTPSFS